MNLDLTMAILGFIAMWSIFLFFLRAIHRYHTRYTRENTWVKDILISFLQTVVIFFVVGPLFYFFFS